MALSTCEYCKKSVKYDARISPPPPFHRECRAKKSNKEVLEMVRAWEKWRNS